MYKKTYEKESEKLIVFIYDLLLVTSLALFAYVVILLWKRAYTDKKYDKLLNINTRGKRSWDKKNIYHRTESTPYLALDSLTKAYQVNPGDQLVDFGAGKGRVFLYLHDFYNIPVTGIEIDNLAYDEANRNISNYLDVAKDNEESKKDIRLLKKFAEEYIIDVNDNKFFFFNPFDVSIFEKVVHNIIKHADETGKEVDIILYYPTRKYKRFLESTEFTLHERIKTAGSISPTEKIEIYKYKKG